MPVLVPDRALARSCLAFGFVGGRQLFLGKQLRTAHRQFIPQGHIHFSIDFSTTLTGLTRTDHSQQLRFQPRHIDGNLVVTESMGESVHAWCACLVFGCDSHTAKRTRSVQVRVINGDKLPLCRVPARREFITTPGWVDRFSAAGLSCVLAPIDFMSRACATLACQIEHQVSDAQIASFVRARPSSAVVHDSDGNLPLTLLAQRLSPVAGATAVRALLKANPAAISVERRGDGVEYLPQYLPLHLALMSGATELAILELLRSHPPAAGISGPERNDYPLHLACEYGATPAVVNALIAAHPAAAHARLKLGDAASEHGYMPLHLCALHGASAAVLRLLLTVHPASAQERGPYGDLPLHVATENGASSEAQQLLLSSYPAAATVRDATGSLASDLASRPIHHHPVEARVPSVQADLMPWDDRRHTRLVRGPQRGRCAVGCGGEAGIRGDEDGVQPALGACLRTVDAPNTRTCCEQCASTLGCIAWLDRSIPAPEGGPQGKAYPGAGKHAKCCLRVTKPNRWPAAERRMCYGVLLSLPCRHGCALPLPKPQEREWLGAAANSTVDVHTFPWVDVQLRSASPLRPAAEAAAARATPPAIAICLAGDARAIVHPPAWRSVWELRGRHAHDPFDLFLVLGTTTERQKLGQHAERGLSAPVGPNPRLLAHALHALRPTATRFVTRPDPPVCGRPAAGQFSKVARCVDLVRAHERVPVNTAPTGTATRNAWNTRRPYEYIFKGRPDVVFQLPIDLAALASNLNPSTILTANDALLMAHRSQWHALTALRPGRLRCDPRCSGHGAPVLRRVVGAAFNEYCLLVAAWATKGIHQLEASHPTEPQWMLHRTVDVIGADASRPAYDYADASWASMLDGRFGWQIARHDALPHHHALGQAAKRALVELNRSLPQPGSRDSGSAVGVVANAVQRYVSNELLVAVVCSPQPTTHACNSSPAISCVKCTNVEHARMHAGQYANVLGIGDRRVEPWALPPLTFGSVAHVHGSQPADVLSAPLPACPVLFQYGDHGIHADGDWRWPTVAEQRASEHQTTLMREALLPLCVRGRTTSGRCPFARARRAERACPPPKCMQPMLWSNDSVRNLELMPGCAALLDRYRLLKTSIAPSDALIRRWRRAHQQRTMTSNSQKPRTFSRTLYGM